MVRGSLLSEARKTRFEVPDSLVRSFSSENMEGPRMRTLVYEVPVIIPHGHRKRALTADDHALIHKHYHRRRRTLLTCDSVHKYHSPLDLSGTGMYKAIKFEHYS